MYRAYISGALTNVENAEEIRSFYEAIGAICNRIGIEPYLPHKHSDPFLNPQMSPEEVYRRDKTMVTSADVLIAYVGIPSIGVGMEVAYAEEYRIPIVLLWEKSRRVSRLVRGLPSQALIAKIVFGEINEGLAALQKVLEEWLRTQKARAPRQPYELRMVNEEGEIFVIRGTREEVLMNLRELHRQGVHLKKIYVGVWEDSRIRQTLSQMWPNVPVYIEFQE